MFGVLLATLALTLSTTSALGDLLVAKGKALLGVPFLATPIVQPGLPHPTEMKVATNCAGVVIYALRHTGHHLPYLSARGLQLELDRRGWKLNPNELLRKGDILHFGQQAAMLAEDYPPSGRLSDNDVILHAYDYGTVRLELWRDIPYRAQYYSVYRAHDKAKY